MSKRSRGELIFLSSILFIASASRGATLEFEDIFGPCGDLTEVGGPGNTIIQGVSFTTPDIHSWNVGKGGTDPVFLRTPFLSDWYGIFTYGPGATITFPTPISQVSFDAGMTDVDQTNRFKLRIGTTDLQSFSAGWTSRTHIAQSFSPPVSSINILFVGDAYSRVGIDTLTYTPAPVPEPGTLGCLAVSIGLGIASRRRRQ